MSGQFEKFKLQYDKLVKRVDEAEKGLSLLREEHNALERRVAGIDSRTIAKKSAEKSAEKSGEKKSAKKSAAKKKAA